MLTLKIHDNDNDAFQLGNAPLECARILRSVAALIERGYEEGHCKDINGNRVGEWEFTGDNNLSLFGQPQQQEEGA